MTRKKIWFLIILFLIIVMIILYGLKEIKKQKVESFSTKAHTYKIYELKISNQEHKLYGKMYIPTDIEGKIPTIIMSHGFGSSANYWNETAESLAMSGYASYCFDFYGGSKRTRSGGKMTEMSIFTEKEDLKAVIEEIKKQKFVDLDNLYLMGESQGGIVSAITAADYENEIKGILLYYPAFLIPEKARETFSSLENVPNEVKQFGSIIGKKYYEELFNFDVYDTISKYRGQVLIIHGDKDKSVDISYSQKAFKVYENSKLAVLKNEIHGFTTKEKEAAAKLSFQYLNNIIN